ncbi:hypothetical protein [Ktedonobacter racemifer]|uniref:Uncharacterized protein n=1 Tax=Ktedonobacter racemifer DSM 44963 TaxID=485913 RepID=D6TM98_KTERA|nr:hypothetical protein [Ktedonobacter racemifer]EFH86898.1 hypothetical protein Krac_8215 [Ktedonobacter racemifer DSM 44963]
MGKAAAKTAPTISRAAWHLHLAAHMVQPEGRDERGLCIDNAPQAPLVSLWRVYHMAQGRTPPFGTPLAACSRFARLASTEQTGMLDERSRVAQPTRPACAPWEPCTQNTHANEFLQEKASESRNAVIHNPYVMAFSSRIRSQILVHNDYAQNRVALK